MRRTQRDLRSGILIVLGILGSGSMHLACGGLTEDMELVRKPADAGGHGQPADDAGDLSTDAAPEVRGYGSINAVTPDGKFLEGVATFYPSGQPMNAPPQASVKNADVDCQAWWGKTSPAGDFPKGIDPGPIELTLVAPNSADATAALVFDPSSGDSFSTQGGGTSLPGGVALEGASVRVSGMGAASVPPFEATVPVSASISLTEPADGAALPLDGTDLELAWSEPQATQGRPMLASIDGPQGSISCSVHPTKSGFVAIPGALIKAAFADYDPSSCVGKTCISLSMANSTGVTVAAGNYDIWIEHVTWNLRSLALPR